MAIQLAGAAVLGLEVKRPIEVFLEGDHFLKFLSPSIRKYNYMTLYNSEVISALGKTEPFAIHTAEYFRFFFENYIFLPSKASIFHNHINNNHQIRHNRSSNIS